MTEYRQDIERDNEGRRFGEWCSDGIVYWEEGYLGGWGNLEDINMVGRSYNVQH